MNTDAKTFIVRYKAKLSGQRAKTGVHPSKDGSSRIITRGDIPFSDMLSLINLFGGIDDVMFQTYREEFNRSIEP